MFTNELPEIVHAPNNGPPADEEDGAQPWPGYHVEDDSTLSISSRNPDTLSEKLTSQYKIIAQFMVDNRLKLNDEKTHLLVMGIGNEHI